MAVHRIPNPRLDPARYYPKPPYVEHRKCKAFGCRSVRSLSYPWIRDNPWCTEHSRQAYRCVQGWESEEYAEVVRRAARPATTFFGWVRSNVRRRRAARKQVNSATR